MLNNKKIFCLSDDEKTKLYLLTTTSETEQILNTLKGSSLRTEYHLLTLQNFDKLLERTVSMDSFSLQILDGYVSPISEEESEVEVQLRKSDELYELISDLFKPTEMNQLPVIDLTALIKLIHNIDRTPNHFELDAFVDLNNPKIAHTLVKESNIDALKEKAARELNGKETNLFINNNPKLTLDRLSTSLKRLLASSKIELLGVVPLEEENEMEVFHSFGQRNSNISTTSCGSIFAQRLQGIALHKDPSKIVCNFLLSNIDYIETARQLSELGWKPSTLETSTASQKIK